MHYNFIVAVSCTQTVKAILQCFAVKKTVKSFKKNFVKNVSMRKNFGSGYYVLFALGEPGNNGSSPLILTGGLFISIGTYIGYGYDDYENNPYLVLNSIPPRSESPGAVCYTDDQRERKLQLF